MIYTHVLNRGGRGVESPVDRLTLVAATADREAPLATYCRRNDRPSSRKAQVTTVSTREPERPKGR